MNTGNPKYTLLKFYADWCGPCKVMDPVVKSVTEKHQIGLHSFNVDDQDVERFSIRSVPTLILINNYTESEVARRVGACRGPDLELWLLNFINS